MNTNHATHWTTRLLASLEDTRPAATVEAQARYTNALARLGIVLLDARAILAPVRRRA